MLKSDLISSATDYAGLEVDPRLSRLDTAALTKHGVDAHWIVRDGGRVIARASLWHRDVPTQPGETLGVIGHYAAADATAGAAILRRACVELTAAGCSRVVGPMDGNTWRSYRFVTERGDEPSFFLEPANPPEWPEQWRAAGFGELASYHSTVTDHGADAADDPRQLAAVQAVADAGIRLRTLDLMRWEKELRRIYAVAEISFQPNFLYTPLSETNFLDLYQPLRNLARPELVFLAEDAQDRPVGFAFGLPDLLNQTTPTAIVKTVAVLPQHAGAGVGRVLVGAVGDAARALGCQRMIHALMHDGNASRHLSTKFGVRMLRRYALFTRPLP